MKKYGGQDGKYPHLSPAPVLIQGLTAIIIFVEVKRKKEIETSRGRKENYHV